MFSENYHQDFLEPTLKYYGLNNEKIVNMTKKQYDEVLNELNEIYKKYMREYKTFNDMIEKFSKDDFYKGHFLAKAYINYNNVV